MVGSKYRFRVVYRIWDYSREVPHPKGPFKTEVRFCHAENEHLARRSLICQYMNKGWQVKELVIED